MVFSPTGCEAMLRALGRLREQIPTKEVEEERSEKERKAKENRKVFIATIGPTTRDYLREKFGVEADVCAETPSPEGVEVVIRKFMRERESG